MNAAMQLEKVAHALRQEKQNKNLLREMEENIAALHVQRNAILRSLEEISPILNSDPSLTLVARRLMEQAGVEDAGFTLPNPKCVDSNNKQRLITKILNDFQRENPNADGMSFKAIKNVLKQRYGVTTSSAGLFFRNEIKKFVTIGGNKNKQILIRG